MASSSSPVVFGEPYDGALVVLVVTGLALALGAVARSWSGGRHSRRVLVAGPALTSVTLPAAAHSAWKGEYISDSVVEQGLKTKEAPDQIQCFDPATGYMLGTVPAMTPAQVVESVKRGRSAQAEWAHTSFDERAQVLQVIYQYLLDHQEEVARVAARDSGKTLVDAAFGEILVTFEKIRWTIANGERVLATEYRSSNMLMSNKAPRVEYVPLGVVAAIVSWNYPFHNMLGPIISAIYAGNAIVVKVSEYTSWSSTYYLEIVRAALTSLGHPADVVQIVTGFAEAGDALVRSGVEKVTFIGSPNVGKAVMKAASDNLTPVLLELGGKDPMIVCDDADFSQTCNVAMRGFFQNCGQNCIGLERLIVHAKIYDQMVAELEKRVKGLRQGAPLDPEDRVDVGAMTMATAYKNIEKLVEDAVKKGARLLVGGRRFQHPKWPKGSYFAPTLLVDVTNAMEISQVEVFGPVVVVMKFKTDQEAIDITNNCPYGLGGSVFSRDVERAERIVSKLRTGMCNINDFAVNYLCQSLPFGGVKISGFDRFAGEEGLRGNCLQRAITRDRITSIRTDIPPPINYPIGPDGFKFVEQLCQAFYGTSIVSNVAGFIYLAVGALSPKKTEV